MAEYIEREQAIGVLIKGFAFHGYAGDTAVNIIKDIPSADVKPVVHGRMEIHSTCIRCSACDERFTLMPIPCNYCPNCGARMDGNE